MWTENKNQKGLTAIHHLVHISVYQPWSQQPPWLNPTNCLSPHSTMFSRSKSPKLPTSYIKNWTANLRPWSSSCLNKLTRNWTSQANLEMVLPNHLTESPQLGEQQLGSTLLTVVSYYVPCSGKPSAPLPWTYVTCHHLFAKIIQLCGWQFSTSIHIAFISRWMRSTGHV